MTPDTDSWTKLFSSEKPSWASLKALWFLRPMAEVTTTMTGRGKIAKRVKRQSIMKNMLTRVTKAVTEASTADITPPPANMVTALISLVAWAMRFPVR